MAVHTQYGVSFSGRKLLLKDVSLYASPGLVLLDEPTAAMDTLTEQFVITVLQQYRHRQGCC